MRFRPIAENPLERIGLASRMLEAYGVAFGGRSWRQRRSGEQRLRDRDASLDAHIRVGRHTDLSRSSPIPIPAATAHTKSSDPHVAIGAG